MPAPVRLLEFVVPAFVGGFTCLSALDAQVNPPEDLKLLEMWSTEGEEIADGITTITGLAETGDGRIWIAMRGRPREGYWCLTLVLWRQRSWDERETVPAK